MSSTRDPWFDNAKMVLVTLVVVGHAWRLLPDQGVIAQAYDFLYVWHMPAFIVVTGYLSQRFDWTLRQIVTLGYTLLVPYVFFEAALAAFRHETEGVEFERLWIEPHWPMWFLLALACWRLATPILRRSPMMIPVAIGLSLLGGLIHEPTLAITRILGFAPFFVVGLHFRRTGWERLRRPWVSGLAVVLLALLWFASSRLEEWTGSDNWVYFNDSYESLGVSTQVGIVIRLVMIVAGLLGALAFFALIPRRRGWFTAMGAFTMVVYLCHGFAVKGALALGFDRWAASHTTIAIAVTTLGAVALALALASPPAVTVLSRVVDPFGTALRRVTDAVTIASYERQWGKDSAAGPGPLGSAAGGPPQEPARDVTLRP